MSVALGYQDMSIEGRIPFVPGHDIFSTSLHSGDHRYSLFIPHVGDGKFCEVMYATHNICLNALHLTIRKFYMGPRL